jgi:hypothetical protein
MEQRSPELPERIKQSALQVKTKDGRIEYAGRYRDGVIVVIHIKRSGCLVTSVDIYDERTPGKTYKGWTNKSNDDIDSAHHQAINFMTGCYDRAGDNYLYMVKCVKG